MKSYIFLLQPRGGQYILLAYLNYNVPAYDKNGNQIDGLFVNAESIERFNDRKFY